MRKVLVIAYYFPPMGLSGVQRTVKFVKYLPTYHWLPTVLTVPPTGYYAKDETLLSDLPADECRILRTASLDPNRLFEKQEVVQMPNEKIRKALSRISDSVFIPDNKIGWRRGAIRAASELFEQEKFDAIFATSPPPTDFLIAKTLKHRFRIPLVLDYRDAWVDYPFKFYPTPLHKFLNYELEKSVLRRADALIVATRSVKELLLRRYKFLTYQDIRILPQGFDPEDFQFTRKDKLPRTDKMRVTYSGVFYENRTPEFFLAALNEVHREYPKLRGRIEACFIGPFREEHEKIISRLGLQNSVNILGYLPHRECVRYLAASDVLWVMMMDDRSSPGKIFEYIGAGKKILGCVPQGSMRTMIEEAGGTCVEPHDVAGIARVLKELYEQFERRKLRGARPEIVDKYNRRAITGDLARILSQLIG